MPFIALLTDFDTIDGYVAAMKGRILSMAPEATIVDITHRVPPYNIRAGAFALFNCYRQFPDGTAFVVVVDPGVGTRRAGVVLRSDRYWFIGPDNGVFSFILQREEIQAYRIQEEALPWEVSATFHGRDVFAPLGALAAANTDALFPYLKPFQGKLQSFWKPPVWRDANHLQAEVLHVDRFGNVILNVRRDAIAPGNERKIKVQIGKIDIVGLKKTFGDVRPGELLINFDSSGFLQIAKNQGNAARELSVQPGDKVTVTI